MPSEEELARKRLEQQEKERILQEQIAERDPAAAATMQGYRVRTQKAAESGVTREAEYDVMNRYAQENGTISRRIVYDKQGKANTEYIWTGQKADGTEGSLSLYTVQGIHSMHDYNNRFKSLTVLQDNVGARTQSFGDSYRFFFNKDSAYTMTDQERLAKERVDSIRKDLITVSQASASKPKKDSASTTTTAPQPKTTTTVPQPGMTATVPQSETIGAPVPTIEKDSAWLGGKDEASLGNAARTLYNLGIKKEEWTKADRAGKKALLEKHIYGQGWGSAAWREATAVVANFYRSKADAIKKIKKERQGFKEAVTSTADGLFGKNFTRGWTAEQRRGLAERIVSNNIGGLADRYKTVGPGGAASETALEESERKAAMWGDASTGKDPAALWAKRSKRIDEIRKIRGW